MGGKSVVHIGPTNSKGGMSTMIKNLVSFPPEGWIPSAINSHSDKGLISKFASFIMAKRKFEKMIKQSKIDIAHIHVTHGASWYRKCSFMRLCEKHGIAAVIHIHSGKFDLFCEGLSGSSVERYTSKEGFMTVVIEERWKKRLSKWTPDDTAIIRNFSPKLPNRKEIFPSGKIRLLHLSRGTKIKGGTHCIDVVRYIKNRGIKVYLAISGKKFNIPEDLKGDVDFIGWVSEEEKKELMEESHFLLSPSKYEGASISIIEAISCGLPVIASDASAETLGITDLILPADDPKKWGEKILIYSEKEAYLSVVKRISEISSDYSPENAAKEWGELYSKLMKGQKNRSK